MKYKTNWIPRAAEGLLYLVLLSTWFLSCLSARFSTGATTSDEARVAMFNVTESSTMTDTFATVMKPGDSAGQKIQVSVKNSSETAVSYTIEFKMKGNLPLTVTNVSGDDTASAATGNTVSALTPAESGEPIWYAPAELAGEQTDYYFQIAWDVNENNYKYSEGIESVTVVITATQED